jgi:hypothetical protein
MTLWNLPLFDNLMQELSRGARATVQRGALMAAVGAIGAVGCGFVIFSAFASLRLLVGPELAALGVGMTLLALAAVLAGLALGAGAGTQPDAALLPPAPLPAADPATVAVFTAAFVLGRRLADR